MDRSNAKTRKSQLDDGQRILYILRRQIERIANTSELNSHTFAYTGSLYGVQINYPLLARKMCQ